MGNRLGGKIIKELPKTIQEIWAGFSGGHDSVTSTHFISKHHLFKGVLHIDTGIGIPETQQYVIDVCRKFNWPLKIYKASEHVNGKGQADPQIYEELVKRFGFPGPSMHRVFYNRLKERCIRQFLRENKLSGDRPYIAISTGFRSTESKRRSKYVNQTITQNGLPRSAIFLSPIINWSEEDCNNYMVKHNLPRNPVKDNLCMSGECLCGAFAKPNELLAIEVHYPEVAERIKRLEASVKKKFPWRWEESPPNWWTEKRKKERLEEEGQLSLFCQNCENERIRSKYGIFSR